MGLLGRVAGRLRPKRKLNIPVIEVGSVLPAVEVEVVPPNATTEGLAESVSLNIAEALGEGKSFLIGMPGAFTPTCTDLHLPGLIQSAKTLGDYGVSNIAVVTTNDRWVISAWRDSLRNCVGFGDSSLTYLADGDGDLVKALGLVEDMGFGVGLRSKRFALMVEDGVVTRVEVDEGMDELRTTGADSLLQIAKPPEVEAEEASEMDRKTLLGGAAVALLTAVAFFNPGSSPGTTWASRPNGREAAPPPLARSRGSRPDKEASEMMASKAAVRAKLDAAAETAAKRVRADELKRATAS